MKSSSEVYTSGKGSNAEACGAGRRVVDAEEEDEDEDDDDDDDESVAEFGVGDEGGRDEAPSGRASNGTPPGRVEGRKKKHGLR